MNGFQMGYAEKSVSTAHTRAGAASISASALKLAGGIPPGNVRICAPAPGGAPPGPAAITTDARSATAIADRAGIVHPQYVRMNVTSSTRRGARRARCPVPPRAVAENRWNGAYTRVDGDLQEGGK